MSRLKSYIDGKLKLRDIMHPSKIPTHATRTRACITHYAAAAAVNNNGNNNAHKYDLFADTKLKNWNRRVESKLAAYINGETSARELVHPSKFPQLSDEVLRQKLQKNRRLQSQQRAAAAAAAAASLHTRTKSFSSDWIHLGKQLEAERTDAATRKEAAASPPPPSSQLSTTSSPDSHNSQSNVAASAILDLLPLHDDDESIGGEGADGDGGAENLVISANGAIVPNGGLSANHYQHQRRHRRRRHPHEAAKNTLVFNGNVNILCLSLSAQSAPPTASAERICDDLKRELRMFNTYTVLPAPSAQPPELSSAPFDGDELQPRQNNASFDVSADILDESSRIRQTAITPTTGYQHQHRRLCDPADDLPTMSPSSNVHELVAIVNELLPTVQTLRGQYKRALSECKELAVERKVLLKHQQISDKTIELLNAETEELKVRNEELIERSEDVVQTLRAETRDLRQENWRLRRKLEKLGASERQLIDVNRTLVKELRAKASEQHDLRLSLDHIRRTLRQKMASLDQCFDAIHECVAKTEHQIRSVQTDGSNTTNSNPINAVAAATPTEKQRLVNTIRRLDEQNSNLLGKVKHMPEKIRSILNHISGTMSSLEEQNIRLLRTLQNSESETFFEQNFLKRIKT